LLIPVLQDAISLISEGISMKLDANIYYVRGYCGKIFKVMVPRSRSCSKANGNLVNSIDYEPLKGI